MLSKGALIKRSISESFNMKTVAAAVEVLSSFLLSAQRVHLFVLIVYIPIIVG